MAFGRLADFAADGPVVAPDLELAIELVGPVQPCQLRWIQCGQLGLAQLRLAQLRLAILGLALLGLAMLRLALVGRSHRNGGSTRRKGVS